MSYVRFPLAKKYVGCQDYVCSFFQRHQKQLILFHTNYTYIIYYEKMVYGMKAGNLYGRTVHMKEIFWKTKSSLL